MAQNRASRWFKQLDVWELGLCLGLNRRLRFPPLQRYFQIVSRLGDGVFWYTLILMLPLFPNLQNSRELMLKMAATGLACLVIYKPLKRVLSRERPFIALPSIQCLTPPLDRYSFPSGHSFHAVGFTTVLALEAPALALGVMPFTLSVLASRVVLGLHYPSDVLAGAALGAGVAVTLIGFW